MNKLYLKRHLPTLISLGVIVMLFFLVSFSYNLHSGENDRLNSLRTELDQLRSKVTIIKTNKSLIKENLDEYNKLLAKLIPDKEDFFSILYALEELSIQTGFQITNYNLSLASQGDKYRIVVACAGNTDTFMKFLKDYNFAGGRLVTNEKIEFTSEEGTVRLALNFYSKKIPTSLEAIAKVSEKDLRLMEQIHSKVKISFKETANESAQYETKSNPFE